MRRRHPERGFTLVELLVATVLLAVGLASMQAAIGACLGALGRVQGYRTAELLVQEKMTELWTGQLPLQEAEGDFGEGREGYSWSLQVANTDREGLQEVLLTVTDPDGRQYRTATLVLTAAASTPEGGS